MTRNWWARFPVMVSLGVAIFLGSQALVAVNLDGFTWAPSVGTITAVLGIVLYRWVSRRFERRSTPELGTWFLLFPGLFAGVVGFGVIMAVVAAAGGVASIAFSSWIGFIAMCGLMLNVAVVEEVLFRAILLRLLTEKFGGWLGLPLSSVLFGVMHLANGGSDPVGVLALVIGGGLLFGAAYLLTGSLWVSVGLHLGLNIAERAVFGIVLADNPLPDHSLFRTVVTGPHIITGGVGGPEGSLVSLIVLGAPAVALTVLSARAGRLRSMSDPGVVSPS